jgi:chromosome segregation ATPase
VARFELASLQATAEKDKASISRLEEMVAKLRKELSGHVRERENVRASTVSKGRQVEQLKDKITRLRNSNQVFMKQIRASAEELGAGRV